MCLLLITNLTGKVAAALLAGSAPVTALALWFVPDLLLAYHLFVPRAQGLGRMHRFFATDRREVWLTIDDGPDPEDTPRLLALLARYGAHATFFVIGRRAARYPELIRAIAAGGHEVAHHTFNHPLATFWSASPARVDRELDLGLETLRAAAVHPTRFRPPAGIRNLWLARALRRRGLTCVGWSARGLERWQADAEGAAGRVLRHLRPGLILLLHEGPAVPNPVRIRAVGRVLDQLRKRGYRCVIPRADQLR